MRKWFYELLGEFELIIHRFNREWVAGWWLPYAAKRIEGMVVAGLQRYADRGRPAQEGEHKGATMGWSPMADYGLLGGSLDDTRATNRAAVVAMLAEPSTDRSLAAELDAIQAKLARGLNRTHIRACRRLRVDPITHHPRESSSRFGRPRTPARARFAVA